MKLLVKIKHLKRELNDLLGKNTSNSSIMPPDRVGIGKLGNALNAMGAGSARVPLVKEAVRQGYNTNYASSWFMVRGGVKIASPTTGALANKPGVSADPDGVIDGTYESMTTLFGLSFNFKL